MGLGVCLGRSAIFPKTYLVGYSVCLFPKELEQYKDINDMVVGGITGKEICKVILNNTFVGLKAKLRFSQLRGV